MRARDEAPALIDDADDGPAFGSRSLGDIAAVNPEVSRSGARRAFRRNHGVSVRQILRAWFCHSTVTLQATSRLRNGLGDKSDLGLGQSRARRQVHSFLAKRFGDRVALAFELREIDRLEMDGYEEGPGLDSLLRQSAPQLVARTAELLFDQDAVHPEDVLRAAAFARQPQPPDAAQRFGVNTGVAPAAFDQFRQAFSLRQSDGRLHIRHAVIEAAVLVPEMTLV